MNARKLSVAMAAMFLVGVGCTGSGKLSVDVRAGGSVTTDGGTTTTDGGATSGTLDLGQGILIARARIVVKKIALEGELAPPPASDAGMSGAMGTRLTTGSRGAANHGEGGDDDGDDDREEDEVKLGPFLIDLRGDQMRGGLVHVFDGDVPAGTYDEIKVVVAPVRNTDAGVSAGIAAMNRASVIIDGTIAEAITDGGPTDGGPTDGGTTDGGTSATPFSFASSLRAAQKHEMEITVNSTTHNLTLTIDPSGWFKAADGGRLDPTVPANQPAIEANLRASIKGFQDEDEGDEEHAGD